MTSIYYFFQVDPFIQTGSLSMTTNSSRTTTAINSIDLNMNDDNEYESITTYAGYITYFGDLDLGACSAHKNNQYESQIFSTIFLFIYFLSIFTR